MTGKLAYEAYRNHTDGKSLVSGQPIPEWDNLHPEICQAWDVAAKAVAREALRELLHSWLDRAYDAMSEAITDPARAGKEGNHDRKTDTEE